MPFKGDKKREYNALYYQRNRDRLIKQNLENAKKRKNIQNVIVEPKITVVQVK